MLDLRRVGGDPPARGVDVAPLGADGHAAGRARAQPLAEELLRPPVGARGVEVAARRPRRRRRAPRACARAGRRPSGRRPGPRRGRCSGSRGGRARRVRVRSGPRGRGGYGVRERGRIDPGDAARGHAGDDMHGHAAQSLITGGWVLSHSPTQNSIVGQRQRVRREVGDPPARARSRVWPRDRAAGRTPCASVCSRAVAALGAPSGSCWSSSPRSPCSPASPTTPAGRPGWRSRWPRVALAGAGARRRLRHRAGRPPLRAVGHRRAAVHARQPARAVRGHLRAARGRDRRGADVDHRLAVRQRAARARRRDRRRRARRPGRRDALQAAAADGHLDAAAASPASSS